MLHEFPVNDYHEIFVSGHVDMLYNKSYNMLYDMFERFAPAFMTLKNKCHGFNHS